MRCQSIFKKALVLFNTRKDKTLSHEALHTMGLFDTHRDGTIYDSDQKFIFTNGNDDPINATDNIMSYNRIRRSTWHWQWKIIKRNAR